ncbi:MAG TPA: S-adenosylmethionine:tRNA ribosyltransferase-isomerase [Chthonomonadaceae bacterium]|nr:S-adenosylmethionine:tRNA ribosyltransferase-isomerase [Chthonomonadaceae bacterium]
MTPAIRDPGVSERASGRRLPTWREWEFTLPPEREAGEPPEARGLARDAVRLMVSYRADNRIVHARFRDLARFLEAGDLLVINTSGTMNAALRATYPDGREIELHLSTRLPEERWVVELRLPGENGTTPFYEAKAGAVLGLPGGGTATLLAPHRRDLAMPEGGRVRLWRAALDLPTSLDVYLERHGFPIRYGYVREGWPLHYYQSVYVTETGSAEMPSAGRAFTPELITRLVARGVQIAPLLLHTGVASLEGHEPPYEEFYRVPPETARLVNAARQAEKRVVAVGTTVVRALETVTDAAGTTHSGEGWTDLVITPERGLRAVNAMLTGFHEPRATHLWMLEALTNQGVCPLQVASSDRDSRLESCLALAGREHLRIAYAEALREGYLWHEFGDLHLILPW